VKVIIGGAPVTADYAERIGADGYGADAVQTVAVVDRLLGVS
jgi:methanogenic corrinoid protein MtbC1